MALAKIFVLSCLYMVGNAKFIPAHTYEGRHVEIGRADSLDVKIFEKRVSSNEGTFVLEYPDIPYHGDLITYMSIDSDDSVKVSILDGGLKQRFATIKLESSAKKDFEATIIFMGAFILRTFEDNVDIMEAKGRFVEFGSADKYDVNILKTELSSKNGVIVFEYPSEEFRGDLVNYISVASDDEINVKIINGGVSRRFISLEIESMTEKEFDVTISMFGAFILRQ